MQRLGWYIITLTLAAFYVRDASPQTRVSAGRDGQSDQVSPAHLNPLLGVSGAGCGLQHDQQRHQPLSSMHSGICWCSSAGGRKASLGRALGVWVEPVGGLYRIQFLRLVNPWKLTVRVVRNNGLGLEEDNAKSRSAKTKLDILASRPGCAAVAGSKKMGPVTELNI